MFGHLLKDWSLECRPIGHFILVVKKEINEHSFLQVGPLNLGFGGA